MQLVENYIDGAFVPPSSGEYVSVTSPSTGQEIAKVGLSEPSDVEGAVRAAAAAFPAWSARTIKARASIMLTFHALVKRHANELADLIVLENGKNKTEALADVASSRRAGTCKCQRRCTARTSDGPSAWWRPSSPSTFRSWYVSILRGTS
jgi:malonate-semialdehyde dehydrogenase (acetylating) / methylmalonate-semialdehyde dehydrogenase